MAIIDRERLLEHIEGDMEMLEDTYQMLCELSQPMLAKLRSAVEAGDLDAIHSAAHAIKGMLANFLADSACETADRIEMIDNPNLDVTVKPLVEQLNQQIVTVKSELQQILDTGES